MKKLNLSIFACIIIATLTTFHHNGDNKEKNAKEIVIFDSSTLNNHKPTHIRKVVLIGQSCNKIKYQITYQNKGDTEGFYRVNASSKSINKDYTGYRGDHSVKLLKGTHSTEYSEWITNEIIATNTYEIWFSIEEIVDKRFHDITDRIKVSFKKDWNHLCTQ